jgi:hypothetical protein
MNPIGSVASAGVISAASRVDQAGANLVKAATDGGTGLASAVVDQINAKAQFDGAVKAWSVSDQITKAALNILV